MNTAQPPRRSPEQQKDAAPNPADLEKRLVVLEKQVRHEMDVRIIAFLLENIKQARSLLSTQEMDIYLQHLGVRLQNPQAPLAAPVQEIFERVEKNDPASNSLESVRILIQAKFKAQDINDASSHYVRQLLSNSRYGENEPSDTDIIRQVRSA